MGELIIQYGREYFYFVLIAVGIFVVLGYMLDWKWMTRMNSHSKLIFIRTLIEKNFGVEGRYKFERFVTLICGIILIILGLVYYRFYKL